MEHFVPKILLITNLQDEKNLKIISVSIWQSYRQMYFCLSRTVALFGLFFATS